MKKKNQNKSSPRLLYISLFALSGALIFLPILFLPELKYHKSLGLAEIALINFITSASLLPTPGFLAVIIGGKVYNPLLVAFVSAVSSSLGQSVGFIFGYSTKKMTASQKSFLIFMEKLFRHKYTPLLIIFLSFIPNPFFDVVGIVAGISLYSPKKFLLWIFIGRFLRDIIIAYAGHRFL